MLKHFCLTKNISFRNKNTVVCQNVLEINPWFSMSYMEKCIPNWGSWKSDQSHCFGSMKSFPPGYAGGSRQLTWVELRLLEVVLCFSTFRTTNSKGNSPQYVRKSMISIIFNTFRTILLALHSTSFTKFHIILVKILLCY